MEEIVILGGGIAGLSCLNALLDHNVSPLLLEGAHIGTPKMCGEFIAPPALPILETWGIGPIQPIPNLEFIVKNKKFNFKFPQPAGAFSRTDAELQLAQRAIKTGGRIRENTRIAKIIPAKKNEPHRIYLQSGEEIKTHVAIFATGKLPLQENPLQTSSRLSLTGIKIHFNHTKHSNVLHMYSFPNAYLGVVPVLAHMSNCAMLAKKHSTKNGKELFHTYVQQSASLQAIFEHVDWNNLDWLVSDVPDFTRKKIPTWERTYWIGDALASFYPAIGYGFAHSISSGVYAAEMAIDNNSKKYLKTMNKQIRFKLGMGKIMHGILQNPALSKAMFDFAINKPWLPAWVFDRLGYR